MSSPSSQRDDAPEDDDVKLEAVEELAYSGPLGGFLPETYTFRLRLYAGGALDGDVWARRRPPLHGLGLLTTRKRRHPDHHGDDGEALAGALQGRWLRRGDGHACEFLVTKRAGHVDRQALACRVELLPEGAAVGTWRPRVAPALSAVANDEVEFENAFEWQRLVSDPKTSATTTTTPSATKRIATTTTTPRDPLALYPLTPGKYQFRGFAAYTVAQRPPRRPRRRRGQGQQQPSAAQELAPVEHREDCLVVLELFADGSLVGTSQEITYPQSCPIRGTWEVGRLRYVLEYRVREATGRFRYTGKIHLDDDRPRVISGKWWNIDDDQAAGQEAPAAPPQGTTYTGGRGRFELECVQATRATLRRNSDVASEAAIAARMSNGVIVELVDDAAASAQVFTTGIYRLRGKAMDDDGYEYESELRLELLPQGILRGTCTQRIFEQVQLIQGEWTRHGFVYRDQYVVKGEVGSYWYRGTLDDAGLVVHGRWWNEEIAPNDTRTTSDVKGEKGTFSFAIVAARRQWSLESHNDFPRAFRERVRCVLLCSQRIHALPNVVWVKIFGFCGEMWFERRDEPRDE